MNTSIDQIEQTSGATQPPAKKPYEKPALSKLGSLRDLTMTKNAAGKSDGQKNRFTGRGGHYLSGGRRS